MGQTGCALAHLRAPGIGVRTLAWPTRASFARSRAGAPQTDTPQAPAHPCPSSDPRRPDPRRPAVVSTDCRLQRPLLPTHPSAPSAPPYPLATAQSFGAARSHPKARPTARLAPRRQAAPAAASLRLSTKLNNMPRIRRTALGLWRSATSTHLFRQPLSHHSIQTDTVTSKGDYG